MLSILWHDQESNGYTDLLPEEWFVKTGCHLEYMHSTRGPRSGIYKAKCNVFVRNVCADLDYEPFDEFNERNGMFLGIMRMQFADEKRDRVVQILWKDKGSKKYQLSSTTISYERPFGLYSTQDIDLAEISGSEGRKMLETHMRRERDPKLVAEKKALVLYEHNELACEVCEFVFENKYGDLGINFCEIHHRTPLAAGFERETSLTDLAILCSNCHRMIHRTNPMMSVEKFRKACLTDSHGRLVSRLHRTRKTID